MRNTIHVTLAGLTAAAGLSAGAIASATPYANLDAFAVRDPARTLVLCDTTAFVASKPQFQSNRMWAHRDGRPPELMLPPYFVQGGGLYLQSSERLQQRLSREGVTSQRIAQIQSEVGRDLIDAYRRNAVSSAFLNDQNRACRQWIRSQGIYGN